jgi:hypothetical protein
MIDTSQIKELREEENFYDDQRFLDRSYHSSQNGFEKSTPYLEFCIKSQIYTSEFAMLGKFKKGSSQVP